MAARPETLRSVLVVHDTVRDAVAARALAGPTVWPVIAQLALAAVGLLATVVFGLPVLWQWIENRLPPEVTVRLDLDSEEMVVPERHNHWARSGGKRYAVVRIQNRRGVQFAITGGYLSTSLAAYPVWFQAANSPRVLDAKEVTRYHIEMGQVGDPARATFTLMSHGWERTYRFGSRGST